MSSIRRQVHGLQQTAWSGIIYKSLPIAILQSGLPNAFAVKDVNVMLFYEKPDTVKSFDLALDYIKNNPALKINVGHVYKVLSNGSDTSKVVTGLCKDIDAAYAQPNGKQPDIIVDFTQKGIPSEAVKLLTKVMTLPTVSAAFGQEGDIRSWRELTEKQKNYLIHIVPPADMLLQAVRSLVSQQKLTSAGILFDRDFDVPHKSNSLLQGMHTRHYFSELSKWFNETGLFQVDGMIDLDIVNFFVAASLGNISNVLATMTKPMERLDSLFSQEYAWYSMSMEPGLPQCKNCKNNVTVIHLEPKLPDTTSKHRAFLTGNGTQHLMDMFYFDLTMNAISTVAKMKEDNTWIAPPKRQCKETKTSPDDYELDLFNNLALPEISKENALGSFHFDPEKIVGKSHSKFQMTIRRLHYNAFEEEPFSNVKLGTWETGFGEKELISTQGVETEWEEHLAQGMIKIATVLDDPYVTANCMQGRITDEMSQGEPLCGIAGSCAELLGKVTDAYNLTYSVRYLSKYSPLEISSRSWYQLYRELGDRRVQVNLNRGLAKVATDSGRIRDQLDVIGISIPVPLGTAKENLLKYLAKYEDTVNTCILNRLRYFSVKTT